MDVHVGSPTKRTRETTIPDILVAVADADAMMQGVPVGIVLAVVRGIVPHLAIGERGVVHLVHHRQSRLDIRCHIGNLMVRHAVALKLQKAAGTIIDCLVLQTVYDSQPAVTLKDKAVVAYLILARETPARQAGLTHEDGGQQVAIIGIEEGV